MAKIPQETIDSVRSSADIVDIVSQEVDLRLRGCLLYTSPSPRD